MGFGEWGHHQVALECGGHLQVALESGGHLQVALECGGHLQVALESGGIYRWLWSVWASPGVGHHQVALESGLWRVWASPGVGASPGGFGECGHHHAQQKVLGQGSCQEEQDLGRSPRSCQEAEILPYLG